MVSGVGAGFAAVLGVIGSSATGAFLVKANGAGVGPAVIAFGFCGFLGFGAALIGLGSVGSSSIAKNESATSMSVYGTIAVVVMIFGSLIPQGSQSFKYWMGYDDSSFAYLFVSVLALIGLALVLIFGFNRGRFGAGVVLGVFGSISALYFLSQSGEIVALLQSDSATYSPIAYIGFFATGALGVVQVMNSREYGVNARQAGMQPAYGQGAGSWTTAGVLANPARWAADPMGRHELRYWDGKKWTDHVSTGGAVSADPVSAPVQPRYSQSVESQPPMNQPLSAPVNQIDMPTIGRPSIVPQSISIVAPGDFHDGRTISKAELETRQAAVRPVISLTFDDGQKISVDGAVVVGRNPSPVASAPGAQLHAISDTTMTVSKTHFAIGVNEAGTWVEDHGSSNGTAIVDSNGSERDVSAGQRVVVPLGASIRFGDRTLRIGRGF